jgi:hypothetical protein
MNELTFTHSFRDGSVCTARTTDIPPDANTSLGLEFDWSRFEAKPELFLEYRTWVLGVVQQLATRWDRSIMYVIKEQIWGVEPNKEPQLLGRITSRKSSGSRKRPSS